MPSASIKKEIPCSKDNLIKMVLDIEKYPEFVPWCLGGKIHRKMTKVIKLKSQPILPSVRVFLTKLIKVLLFMTNPLIQFM